MNRLEELRLRSGHFSALEMAINHLAEHDTFIANQAAEEFYDLMEIKSMLLDNKNQYWITRLFEVAKEYKHRYETIKKVLEKIARTTGRNGHTATNIVNLAKQTLENKWL